jgi:hypothetical protein
MRLQGCICEFSGYNEGYIVNFEVMSVSPEVTFMNPEVISVIFEVTSLNSSPSCVTFEEVFSVLLPYV